jgi:hypothetical protein
MRRRGGGFYASLEATNWSAGSGEADHTLEGLGEGALGRTPQSNRLFLHCECYDINYYSVTRIVICFDGSIISYSFPKQFVANNTPQILTCGR